VKAPGVRLLSCSDAAIYCDVAARCMRAWMRDGLLPGTRKIGRLYYVDEPSLRAFIGDSRQPSTTRNDHR
jgi:hypothetical protein